MKKPHRRTDGAWYFEMGGVSYRLLRQANRASPSRPRATSNTEEGSGAKLTTSLVDCRSTRFTLYLTNKTDETVCYLIYSARAVGRIDPPPAESWKVVISPRATIALSADDIFGYQRRGDEVSLSTWIPDSPAEQGGKKQDETIYFTP
jgi:hypothetical protein